MSQTSANMDDAFGSRLSTAATSRLEVYSRTPSGLSSRSSRSNAVGMTFEDSQTIKTMHDLATLLKHAVDEIDCAAELRSWLGERARQESHPGIDSEKSARLKAISDRVERLTLYSRRFSSLSNVTLSHRSLPVSAIKWKSFESGEKAEDAKSDVIGNQQLACHMEKLVRSILNMEQCPKAKEIAKLLFESQHVFGCEVREILLGGRMVQDLSAEENLGLKETLFPIGLRAFRHFMNNLSQVEQSQSDERQKLLRTFRYELSACHMYRK